MSKRDVLRAVKEKCLDCSVDDKNEVKLCPITDCPLYKYRFGKDPDGGRKLTDEQKAAAAERLRKARESKDEAK